MFESYGKVIFLVDAIAIIRNLYAFRSHFFQSDLDARGVRIQCIFNKLLNSLNDRKRNVKI